MNSAWSLKACVLPQTSCLARLAPPLVVDKDIDALGWLAYKSGSKFSGGCIFQKEFAILTPTRNSDIDHKQHVFSQPSNLQSVFVMFCDLSLLVHKSLYVMYAGKAATAASLLTTYTQYLEWYDHMPHTLKLGENSTPAVLFAQLVHFFPVFRTSCILPNIYVANQPVACTITLLSSDSSGRRHYTKPSKPPSKLAKSACRPLMPFSRWFKHIRNCTAYI